ncbi:MAG: hypothetical protein ACI9H6_000803 [Patiriisocius sp.]|jgi:hypothetical protein
MSGHNDNEPDGSDEFTEGVHGDSGPLPQNLIRTPTGGDIATDNLMQNTSHQPVDDSAEAAEAARLADVATLAGGTH